jgi:D-alanine-D-alanine ligase
MSHERDVSIRSGRRVAENLRGAGLDVTIHDVDADLIPALAEDRPDVVWPLLHGAGGEDGSLGDVLELLDIHYLGTGPRASRLAWNKAIAKTIVSRTGVATPEFVTLPQSLFRELGAGRVLESVLARFGLPLVVKPSRGGSALGVTLVREAAELPRAMVAAFNYDTTALIERAVVGREVAVGVIGSGDTATALPAVEIRTEGPYDYDARYNAGRAEYFSPAPLSDAEAAAVAQVATAAHRLLGLRDLSRTDVMIDATGTPQFLEVSVAPGMTETSVFPQAALAAGYDLPTLYGSLVTDVLARVGGPAEEPSPESTASTVGTDAVPRR